MFLLGYNFSVPKGIKVTVENESGSSILEAFSDLPFNLLQMPLKVIHIRSIW